MTDKHNYMKALKCRECAREYPLEATHVCEFDFGPLEVAYDYDRIKKSLTREIIQSRPKTMWRYRELLPIAGEPTVGPLVGFTPLVKADRLAKKLGIRELYVKNDAVNYPTLSFKDRVVTTAINAAHALNLDTIGCASTGNLANAVAAHAAKAGLTSWIFIPENLEREKILATAVYGPNLVRVRGTYD
ncbi:MAG TPA: pyridoxal-phosphate dependent enzyme, partial [Verrucomicrobiae bacterium]|nr:pyridoxal-phosphate dependent enzyme [Verrucomicrobiae bacterium]